MIDKYNNCNEQDNELERLRAENALLKADIRLLKSGRDTIAAQADACTFRANKNAEAYNKIKAENAKLRELVGLAVQDIIKCCCCDTCKNDNADNHCGNNTVCRNCFYKNWQWQHADKLKANEGKQYSEGGGKNG